MDKLNKNGKEEMPIQSKAKMDTLKALRKLAMEMIHERSEEDPSGMSKVMVAADDKEGLEEGLDKAKDVLSGLPEDDSEEMELGDSLEPEDEEAELVRKLMELRAKKKRLA